MHVTEGYNFQVKLGEVQNILRAAIWESERERNPFYLHHQLRTEQSVVHIKTDFPFKYRSI